ncbi:MAG: ABC transporter permease [Clostridia bacterium]|nr:ABC transporter permease [Clostridia bacterium]
MKQFNYILKRVLQMIPVLFLVTVIIFWGIRLIPGNPALTVLGEKAPQSAIEAMEKKMGLDQPIWKQYLLYMQGIFQGDLGTSIRLKQPVLKLFQERSVVTITYTVMSTLFTLIIGIPAGYIAGITKKGMVSKSITSTSLVFLSLPEFWFAILLLFFFGLKLSWVPVGGWGNTWPEHIYSMLLPAFTGAIGSVGLLVRNIQAGVQKILARDYVDFARSKGLAKPLIRSRYVLKNVMVSTITLIAMRITSTLGGSVVIETVFALPGLGSMLVNAINGRDYILVQGTVLLYAVIVLVVTLITDITYSFIDPRVKLQ